MAERRKLSDEIVLEMRRKMDKGKSVQDVAAEYELPYFMVYAIRRGWTYAGVGGPIVARSRGVLTPAKAKKIRALRAKGATIDQLAQAAGLGRTSIKKALAGRI